MKQRLFAVAALTAALLLPRLAPAALAPDFAAAEVAPGDALVYLSLPDPKRSVDAWKGSALYKIWQEPEVQTFFGKPISQIPPIPPEANEVLAKVDTLKPRSLFVAISSFDQKDPSVILGFQFEGGRPALDSVLEKLIQDTRKKDVDGKASVVTHGNRTIEVFTGKKTMALCVADKWCFLGSSVDLVKAALDRYDKKPGASNALSETPEFKSVIKRLPEKHDTLAYVFAPPLTKMLLTVVEQSGTKLPPDTREQLASLKALGATTVIADGQVKDTIFGLSAAGWAPGKISLRSLGFTTSETLMYFTSMLRFPEEPKPADAEAKDKDKPASPRRAQEPVAKLLAEMEAAGFPLKDVKEAIQNEASLQLDWPNGAPWPSPILSVELKDRALVQRLIDRAVAKAGPQKGQEWKIKVEDGVEYRSLVAVPNSKPVTPTIAITDKHVLFGINPTEVRSAVVRSRNASSTRLDATPAYKDAIGGATPDQTLMYVDLRGLFQKAYGMARGFAPALSDTPAVTKSVDLDKLPNTESIARHLVPLVLTTERTDDGLLLKSNGVLSAPQLIAATFAGIGFGVNAYKSATKAFDTPKKGRGGRDKDTRAEEEESPQIAPPVEGKDSSKADGAQSEAAPKKKKKN